MKCRISYTFLAAVLAAFATSAGCDAGQPEAGTSRPEGLQAARVLFLHHSTGECIWNGGVPAWFETYNAAHGTRYAITEQAFPKDSPYGWENYPYDYWNIWVKNAGSRPHKDEPTLEMLAPRYDVIILKHCFPVSSVEADTGNPDVASSEKRLENYKLQYEALKKKFREFPRVRFVVWTAAALRRSETDAESARRVRAFVEWVRDTWDEKGDNIFLWDFNALETDGGLYLKDAYAAGDSHPNETFSRRVAPHFSQRVVDVIEGRGDTASILGKAGTPPDIAPPDPPKPPPSAPAIPPTPGSPKPAVEPAQKTPAAAPKTHALPADATATVILFDYCGGMLKPQNDDPLMVIRADGSVTLETWGRGNLGTLPMFSETRNTKFGKPVGPGPVEI
jgi:hypothetical protein